MDYGDGELRFKSSTSFAGMELTSKIVRNVILPAMMAVDAYADALADVALHGKSAISAMGTVEDE
jgi:hypothetical protein